MHGETSQVVTTVLSKACIRTSLNVSCFSYHILKCPPKLPSKVKYRHIQKILNIFLNYYSWEGGNNDFSRAAMIIRISARLASEPLLRFLGKKKKKTIKVCHKVLGCSSAEDIWLACVRSSVPSRGKTNDDSKYHKEILLGTNKARGTHWGSLLAHQGVESK